VALTSRAAAWRPWRSYAVQYLWATADHAINKLPAQALPSHRTTLSPDDTATRQLKEHT